MSRYMFYSRVPTVLVAVALLLYAAPLASGATATEFSGQATVLKGTVTVPILGTQTVNVADTGALAPEGGAKQNCVLSYPGGQNCQFQVEPDVTNGAVQATLLSSKTVGHGNASRSRAEVANLSVDLDKLLGTGDMFPTITASALSADANAVCQAGVAAVSGGTDILDLGGLPAGIDETLEQTVDGVLVQISRTVITLPAGTGYVKIFLNEQIVRTHPNGKKEIEVNALRIETSALGLAAANLIVGFAHADIRCGSNPGACPGDKFTGGAWDESVPVIAGSPNQQPRRVHATLAAAHLSSWGHFLYMDKVAGIKFHGQPANAVLTPGVDGRSGNALVTGTVKHGEAKVGAVNVGFFVVDATDVKEPGRHADQFTVALFETQADYSASEDPVYQVTSDVAAGSTLPDGIDGGNWQYHGCKKNA
jgi:hypothetical protein